MPDGGTVTIETSNVRVSEQQSAQMDCLDVGEYVRVTVVDTGIGMPASAMAQAFEPFFTTKPIGQGTGLGLSMIYGYAKQSRGTVLIRSAEGKGTSVDVYLPRASVGEIEGIEGREELPPHTSECKRILVVEDDEVVRRMVVKLLCENGFDVLEATDGKAAMTLLATTPSIDMLLSDVGLPGPNGRQVADYALERFPGLRIILMTGYAAAVATGAEIVTGNAELIVKPFDMDELLRKIAQMFQA